jgi:hypothetical protein
LQENKVMMLDVLIMCLVNYEHTENFLTNFNLEHVSLLVCPCVAALVSYIRVKKLRHTLSYPEDLNPLKHIYVHLISCTVQLLN